MSRATKNRLYRNRLLIGLVVAIAAATTAGAENNAATTSTSSTTAGEDDLANAARGTGTTTSMTKDPSGQEDDEEAASKTCSYLLLAPFSSEKDDEPDANYTEQGTSYAVSALMALEELNRIVASNSTLCNKKQIQFGPLLVRDSQEEDTVGFGELVRAVQTSPDLCGVVGPVDGKGQEKAILYTEVMDLPTMLVTGADVDDLAGKDGKTAVANFVSADHYMDLLGEYWKQQLGLTHVVFLGTGSKKVKLLRQSFATQMEHHGLEHRELVFAHEHHITTEGIQEDLQQVIDTGFRNVFLVTDYRNPKSLVQVANELDQLGMLDGNYQYFLYEDNVRPREIDFLFGNYLDSPESPIAKLLHGAGFFTEIDPFEVSIYRHNFGSTNGTTNTAVDDTFVQRWKAFDPRRIDYPKTATPVTAQDLQRLLPTRHSSYVYDSIMAMGLAECYASAAGNDMDDGDSKNKGNGGDRRNMDRQLQGGVGDGSIDKGSSNDKDGDKNDRGGNKGGGGRKKKPRRPKRIRNKVVRAMIDMPPFQGESGMVDFEQDGDLRYRSLTGMRFAMFNFRVVTAARDDSNNIDTVQQDDRPQVQVPITALVRVQASEATQEDDGNDDQDDKNQSKTLPSGKLSQRQWEFLEDFIFSSSSKEPPSPQFAIADENFLSDGVFALGMTLFAIGCIAACGFFAAVTCLQADRAVKMAQPFFLKLICVGSLVEVLAILLLSFDEGRGWSQGALDFGCMSSLWLFFIGHALIYTAIFCKLWRIDRVMTAKRRVVTEWQVLWPVGVVLLAIIILLVCWTAIDPWKWKREFTSLVPPVTTGTCESDSFAVFFAPLAAILMLCTFLTACFVWKTKNLAQDLSDTSTVFYLILTQLQAWFVGLPINVVVDGDSVDSVYLGRILLIWLFAIAPLTIVLLPRITQALQNRRNPERRPNRPKVHISGVRASILRTPHSSTKTTLPFWSPGGGSRISSHAGSVGSKVRKVHPTGSVTEDSEARVGNESQSTNDVERGSCRTEETAVVEEENFDVTEPATEAGA